MLKKLIGDLLPRKLVRVLNRIRGGMQGETFRFQEDGLSCIHNCDFLADARFQRAYAAGCATGSWQGCPNRWRAYVVCWCAEWASRLPGDFVECGVNRGGYARMIIDYVGFQGLNKRFLLFDTFRGLPEALLLPEEKGIAARYHYSDCLKDVKSTFQDFSSVSIFPGTVPETLAGDTTGQVSLLSIDMNCVQPEIAAAEHFWPKLAPGGIIVLDDYGFTSHIAQKHAFDAFAKSVGTSVLSLPTGQGLIFKR